MSFVTLTRVRPVPVIAAAVALGIQIATTYPHTAALWFPLAIAAGLAVLVFRSGRLLAVSILAVCAGALRLIGDRPAAPLPTGKTVLSGTVSTPPRERQMRWSWQLDTGDRRILVFQSHGAPPRWGETVRVMGNIDWPEGPTNPGQFDFRDWMQRQGIRQTLRTSAPVQNTIDTTPLWSQLVRNVRERVEKSCESNLAPSNSGLASGILLSITDDIPYELREAFESTGTVHLLSTSGFHLSTLASATAVVFSFARPWTRSGVTLVLVWIIAVASGGGAAPVRSATMASLATIAPLLGRRSDGWNVLASAACIALLSSPKLLFDVGAQLSFATVGALILSSSAVRIGLGIGNPWNSKAQSCLRGAAAALIVSSIAHAASSPLIAHHLFRFQPWAPLINVPATVLGSSLLVSGAIAVLVSAVPVVGPIVWILFEWQLTVLSRFVLWAGRLPGADISIAPGHMGWTVIQVAAVMAGAAWASRRFEARERGEGQG